MHHGPGQWNGVAILSRAGVEDVTSGFDGTELVDPYEGDARLLSAMCGGVRVICVYVPNGRQVGTDFYERKLVVARDTSTTGSPPRTSRATRSS